MEVPVLLYWKGLTNPFWFAMIYHNKETDERESKSEETGIASCGRWKRSAGARIECTREGKLNGCCQVGDDGMIRRYQGSAYVGTHEWTRCVKPGGTAGAVALVPAEFWQGRGLFLLPLRKRDL